MHDTKLANASASGSDLGPKDASLAEPPSVRVTVNGEVRMTAASTLAALLDESGYGESRVATAVDGEFVPARMRDQTRLVEGCSIEIVAPRQGG